MNPGPLLIKPDQVHGAILAGGGATRMGGAPKGLLEVGGRRIIDRLVHSFQTALGKLPLLVANSPDAASWRSDLRVVADLLPGTGSLGGLYTAVTSAPAPVVCVAWDMPFVPSELIRFLAQELEHADVCIPASGGRRGLEPLCAGYGPACGPAMARALDQGDLRAVAFHQAVRVKVIPEADLGRVTGSEPSRLWFNVNTPEDLLRANGMAS